MGPYSARRLIAILPAFRVPPVFSALDFFSIKPRPKIAPLAYIMVCYAIHSILLETSLAV
jgi:hypothetical protein